MFSKAADASQPVNKTARQGDDTPYTVSKADSSQPINKPSRRGGDHWSSIAIDQIDIKTGKVVQTFESPREAANRSSIDKDMIINCVQGSLSTAGGYMWVKTGTGGSVIPVPGKTVVPSMKKPSSRGRIPWSKIVAVDAETEDEDGDEDEDDTLYCICQGPSVGRMIACENPKCTAKWFHYGCVGIIEGKEPAAGWFCPPCIQEVKEAFFMAAKKLTSSPALIVPATAQVEGNDDDIVHDGDDDDDDDDHDKTPLVIKRPAFPPVPAPVPAPVPVLSIVAPPFGFPSERMNKVKEFFTLLVAGKDTTDIKLMTRLENQAFGLENAVFKRLVKEDLMRARITNPAATARGASERAAASATGPAPAPATATATTAVALASASRPYEGNQSSASATAVISMSTSSSPPTSPSSLATSTRDSTSTLHPAPTTPVPLITPTPDPSAITVPVHVPVCAPVSLSPDRMNRLAEIKKLMLARIYVPNVQHSKDTLTQLEHHAIRLEQAVFNGEMDMGMLRVVIGVRPCIT